MGSSAPSRSRPTGRRTKIGRSHMMSVALNGLTIPSYGGRFVVNSERDISPPEVVHSPLTPEKQRNIAYTYQLERLGSLRYSGQHRSLDPGTLNQFSLRCVEFDRRITQFIQKM